MLFVKLACVLLPITKEQAETKVFFLMKEECLLFLSLNIHKYNMAQNVLSGRLFRYSRIAKMFGTYHPVV